MIVIIQQVTGQFPGGPVVRTQGFHCHGPRVQSLVGELRSHKLCSAAKKKKKITSLKKVPFRIRFLQLVPKKR